MYVCWGPQKAALLHMGGKHKVTAHRAHADGRPHTMGCGLVPSRTCSVSHIPFPLTIVAQTLPYNREQKCDCVYLGFLPLMAGLWRLVKEIVYLIYAVQKITVVHTKYCIKEPQLWFRHTAQNSHNSLKYFIPSHRWLKWVLYSCDVGLLPAHLESTSAENSCHKIHVLLRAKQITLLSPSYIAFLLQIMLSVSTRDTRDLAMTEGACQFCQTF